MRWCTYLLVYLAYLHSWPGIISETVEDRAKVTINGPYKVDTSFGLPPKCMTLNDLCARFKVVDILNAAKWRNTA